MPIWRPGECHTVALRRVRPNCRQDSSGNTIDRFDAADNEGQEWQADCKAGSNAPGLNSAKQYNIASQPTA